MRGHLRADFQSGNFPHGPKRVSFILQIYEMTVLEYDALGLPNYYNLLGGQSMVTLYVTLII